MTAGSWHPREGAAAEGYGVRIDDVNFEGPLDLLLYLIRKNEIDIGDIPIARITEQFLACLDRISAADLEAAGDFLLMAATLMRIKAQMLLPRPDGLDEGDLEDPRRELVARILEYQQFKEIAERLRDCERDARRLHPRGGPSPLRDAPPESAEPLPERRVSLKDLLRAFAAVLAARPERAVHHVEAVRITLEERLQHVRRVLAVRGSLPFGELFPPQASRLELVVTLIALLEMVRAREVRLRQEEAFGEIMVSSRERAAGGEGGQEAADVAGHFIGNNPADGWAPAEEDEWLSP
ncbi:MAG: segregation/condensation protein A [Gemmatimonadetes bacterium]|nr:segregation/condensation protein A [Gemmatimonadota bacterium]